MNAYPLIADHGLIGDPRTAAPVTNDGEIDWFRSPRFDSPSVSAFLLDRQRDGRVPACAGRTAALRHRSFTQAAYAVLLSGPSGAADIGGATAHPAHSVATLTVVFTPRTTI